MEIDHNLIRELGGSRLLSRKKPFYNGINHSELRIQCYLMNQGFYGNSLSVEEIAKEIGEVYDRNELPIYGFKKENLREFVRGAISAVTTGISDFEKAVQQVEEESFRRNLRLVEKAA